MLSNWVRAFESTVLNKLLEWGSASIDKSLNQPALSHAVIVLNATDNVYEDKWNIEAATARLLDDISGVDLHAAYDHVSRDLDTPFDFVKEALKHNPIPQDFSGNILYLAI
ncbi:hypothetical protein SGCOL_002480 [Colletotrichum sp. CLE4]